MNKAVFGIANSTEHADRIVNRLLEAGFSEEEISVLFADREGKMKKYSQEETARNPKQKRGTLGTEKHTKAPEGGVTGGITGGIIGGSIGLLAGLGSLAIPGLGVFIAAGPILGALSGGGIGAAVGLLVGALVGMGIPEYEAKKYEDQLKSGGVLVCVHARDSKHLDNAKEILQKEGAKDISTSREKAAR